MAIAATLPDPMRQHSLAELLELFFSELDRLRIRYCILHSFDGMPGEIKSDLDLAIHEDDKELVPSVLSRLLDSGYAILQHRYYAVRGHRFDFGWFEGDTLRIVGLDLIFEYRYAGVILLSGEQMTRDRMKKDGVWIASPALQFKYLLAKRALKKTISPSQEQELQALLRTLGVERGSNIAITLLGASTGEATISAIQSGTLKTELPKMRWQLHLRNNIRCPENLVRYWLPEIVRKVRRWLRPTGLFLVFLGPDGSGKNTLISQVEGALTEAFRSRQHFHWRPGVLWKLKNMGRPAPAPHEHDERPAIHSVAYLIAFQLDYWCGYLRRIYPALTKSGLVLFNRYLYDMQVDGRRYRYGGPRWLLEMFARLLPGDPLTLILDGEPEEFHRRKPELTLFELARQRMEFRALAEELPQSFLIDANVPITTVTRQALGCIATHLTKRNVDAYPEWFGAA